MKPIKTFFGLLFLGSVALAGCEVFEDQTPEFINVRMDGPSGDSVTIIYSSAFVAGINEEGVTRVQVFDADTVVHVLPIDTVIDVRVDRRIFLQGLGPQADTIQVGVDIDVDGRTLFDGVGDLFPDVPWLFLYQFNTLFSDDIEIVL